MNHPLPRWISNSIPAFFLSKIFGQIIRIRNKRFDTGKTRITKVKNPVISIGGIRAGGTGKTPVTLLIAQNLKNLNCPTAILSRGYKRKSEDNLIIPPFQSVSWEQIGDEPAMMHQQLPEAWFGISAKRVISAKQLENCTPPNTVFLLDDGFQHRSLYRNLDIICVDESILEDKLIPVGFLREPADSISRAQIAILSGNEQQLEKLQTLKRTLSSQFSQTSFFILIQKKDCWVEAVSGKRSSVLPYKNPVAVCGIARPERFFEMLHTEEISPYSEIIFPDHHIYTEYDIKQMQKLYSQGLVTTQKDAIRLLNQKVALNSDIWYLKIKLEFENEGSLKRFNKIIEKTIFNA
ncbi:MAG: tetraacyldisaccharide 4'-kinase [Fibrobacter sp.]|nr:tetraacyldisaccharide 4'-kinase [Fibrobacter sp.]